MLQHTHWQTRARSNQNGELKSKCVCVKLLVGVSRSYALKSVAPFTKAASSSFHRVGWALLACGNASRGNENTGKSLQLFRGERNGSCSCKITQTRSHTHVCRSTCTLRALVTYRDDRVNLKNINTGVWLQRCQDTIGASGS